jgi:signal transduction histidine kinase/sugar lactone lactonase YvrE
MHWPARGTRRWVSWLALLLLTPALDVAAERLPIRAFTTVDGLPHNRINRIVRDSRGFLWFCTADGLSRFDGYTFINYGTEHGLPHASINDLLETRAGEYWVATNGGLVRFDPRGRPDRRVVTSDDEPAGSPPMFTVVPDAADPRGKIVTVLREGRDRTIWVGTRNGLHRLHQGDGRRSLRPVEIRLPTEYPEQRIIADVLEDAGGSLWIAAPSGLYRRWPDGHAARYTERDGLPHQYLADLLEDHEGRLWAGTRLGGFFRFTADDGPRAPAVDLAFTYPDDLPTSWVFQLFETSGHRFWLATARGLVEFFPAGDNQGRRFRSYGTPDGLTDYNITALNEDISGNLWLGTASTGGMKLAGRGFSSFGERDGLRQVSDIFIDRTGNVCFRGLVVGDTRTSVFEGAALGPLSSNPVGYHSRLGCFDGERFDWFRPAAVTDPGWVTQRVTLQTRSGEWWVGTGEGLYRFPATDRLTQLKTARPRAVYTMKHGLAGPQVYRLFEDSRGDVWISTTSPSAAGLARWERLANILRDVAGSPGLSSLADDWAARSFCEDRAGNVWVGFDGELARFRDGRFELFTATQGLPPGAIGNMHVDRSGRLWLASARSGLVRVDDPVAEHPAFVKYTTAEGLSSDNIEVITEDDGGRIYVGGGRGLDRLDPSTGRIQHFGGADGLEPGIFRAAFKDRQGVLWFGTTSGLARFTPAPEAPMAPPPVLITRSSVAGVPQPVSALGERRMSLPDLASRQNHLQVDFVGLAFGSGEVLRYQHRLEGADRDWSALSAHRTVTFASLAPGRYTFAVRAVDSAGHASADPATLSFAILRPVWQRWWFLGLAAFAVGFVAHAGFRYRVARLLEIANLRTQIATDLHDDIGANLTRIALLGEVARQTRAEAPIDSIARIARESVSSMGDIVWAIDPRRESLLDLVRRMRQHAEEVFALRDIELRFNVPSAVDSFKLGMEARRDLLLLFKEAINNAARHSGCSAVAIDLHVAGSRVLLTVADNGAGFDASVGSEGQGLTSMQQRARRLGGTLNVTSAIGSGTTVSLDVPL